MINWRRLINVPKSKIYFIIVWFSLSNIHRSLSHLKHLMTQTSSNITDRRGTQTISLCVSVLITNDNRIGKCMFVHMLCTITKTIYSIEVPKKKPFVLDVCISN